MTSKDKKKLVYINYMEPLPSNSERPWRGHIFCDILSESYDVTYFTSSFDHFKKKPRKKVQWNKDYNLDFVKTIQYKHNSSPLRILSFLIFSFNSYSKIKKIKPKVIIASYPQSFSLIGLLIYKKFNEVNLIIDVRDSIFKKVGSLALHKKIIWYIYYFIEWICSLIWVRNKKFIGLGEHTYKYISDYFLFPKSSIQMEKYNYVPMPYKRLNVLNGNKNHKTFVFIGSITNSFDFSFIEEVLSDKENKLHIIGDDRNNILSKYHKYSNLFLHGYLSEKQSERILNKSIIGVLPYINNGGFNYHITNKLPEYLSFGLSLMVPEHCLEMAKLIKDNHIGFTYNNKNTKKKINKFLKSYKNNAYAANSIEAYQRLFNISNIKIKLFDSINSAEK